MFGIFFVFFSSITLLNAQLCPDTKTPPNLVDCVLVPGCNFDNGTLTPLATQCSNQLSDGDCQLLFPCPTSAIPAPPSAPAPPGSPPAPAAAGIPACDPNANTGTAGTSTTYPYVRAPACLSPDAREVALQCK